MRCREAKLRLDAQRDGDQAQPDVSQLQEHLKQCPICRTYELHQKHLETRLRSTLATSREYATISTDRIMRAVQNQRRITQQLEDMRMQQRTRLLRLRVVGPSVAAIIFFTLGSIPLMLLALMIVQPDLLVNTLSLLSDIIAVCVVLIQYLLTALTLVTHDNWLLSGVAFAIVILMGMWLRLMRYPQEA